MLPHQQAIRPIIAFRHPLVKGKTSQDALRYIDTLLGTNISPENVVSNSVFLTLAHCNWCFCFANSWLSFYLRSSAMPKWFRKSRVLKGCLPIHVLNRLHHDSQDSTIASMKHKVPVVLFGIYWLYFYLFSIWESEQELERHQNVCKLQERDHALQIVFRIYMRHELFYWCGVSQTWGPKILENQRLFS